MDTAGHGYPIFETADRAISPDNVFQMEDRNGASIILMF
jgi:hypothetical protein